MVKNDDRVYTCPMHLQIRQKGPGDCPICGMALEPAVVSAEPEENLELKNMTRRFWVSTLLTIPLVIIAMSAHVYGKPLQRLMDPNLLSWLELILGTPVVLRNH